MDPTKGQDPSPRNGRTQPGSQTYTNPQSGRTPPRVKTTAHEVDGPHQVLKLISPQNGRTPPRVKTIVHKVNEPGKGKKNKNKNKKTHVHDMDGPNNGQNSSPRRGRTR